MLTVAFVVGCLMGCGYIALGVLFVRDWRRAVKHRRENRDGEL